MKPHDMPVLVFAGSLAEANEYAGRHITVAWHFLFTAEQLLAVNVPTIHCVGTYWQRADHDVVMQRARARGAHLIFERKSGHD